MPVNMEVGQHLHADFGFVCGSDYAVKTEDGQLVTSKDGFRSYCLVIDRASRYIWIILTASKTPPIDELRNLLMQLQSKVTNTFRTITTDLGRELGTSKSFQKMLNEKDIQYVLKTTGAHSSAQNGLAEKPNHDLARMMRTMLHGAGLGSEYWSYALRHAVYLKNRLPHTALKWVTPYEKMNKIKPDLSRLRVFGSKVHYMDKPRGKKLDRFDRSGKFMTFKGTDKIGYVIDDRTLRERITTHISFDEAGLSQQGREQPPMATALQTAGYRPEHDEQCRVKVKMMDPNAIAPVQATHGAAAFDLHSTRNFMIKPGAQEIISTGLSLEIPEGYHGQIHVRSSYAVKHKARVEAGLIDSDYRGEVFVIMSNNGTNDLEIGLGDRIAQMTIVKDPDCTLEVAQELTPTKCNIGKFGSTGRQQLPSLHVPPKSTTAAAATLDDAILQDVPQVDISNNPFINEEIIEIKRRGNHKYNGLQLSECKEWDNRIVIDGCQQGTAAARIQRWRTRLRHNVLLRINGINITTLEQVKELISATRSGETIKLTIGQFDRQSMHIDKGIPMIYFDQLAAISTHLQQIRTADNDIRINPAETQAKTGPLIRALHSVSTPLIQQLSSAIKGILPKSKQPTKRLTRWKLKDGPDWEIWKMAEWQQLDMYYNQKMFGIPCPLPKGANVLSMLWYYNIKDDGRKKASMVCNGKPSNKNTAIFGYTYAKSLDHVGSRIFWATAAAKNYIVRGADASNAFAEADAPKIPLFVRLNDPYREWWKERMDQPTIPKDFVLPVHKALQGHPEAPRAWAILIDKILQEKLHLKPTMHEPCLYYGKFNGHDVLFLRQVDDFAVAAENSKIATDIINKIDTFLSIKIKDLGQLERYNGVDIVQARNFITINNPTYIDKIVNEHRWMIDDCHMHNLPIPVTDEKELMRQLETAELPTNEEEQRQLQIKMRFNYRQAIGELIFAMVTCRPDLSFPLIKLSQYSANPAQVHYEAVISMFQYLHATRTQGLTYWRDTPHPDLPDLPAPKIHKSTYDTENTSEIDSAKLLHGAVDSDWAGDTKHRKSVSGIILRLAGGTIYYKTKYQDTVALSTTEAEFTAACDAGKAILYVRSILDEIEMPQETATALYIDNNGALLMGNAQKPTRRTRHMDLKKFALLEWIQTDLIILK
jgi:deoxyuridine 5'-triphosphate nucleotidohydrolase